MQYKLIKPINQNYSALEQVLTNRGIDCKDIPHYTSTTDDDINDYKLLGIEKLQEAVTLLTQAISNNENIAIVVD